MIDVEPLIRSELERIVPPTLAPARWADVVARAEALASARLDEPRLRIARSSRKRLLLVAAVAAALLAVASALAAGGHDPFGAISSWLNGSLGPPASVSEQAGFAARNNASYVAFPANTKLRQVARVAADGKTFDLLGFKSGESLCLELVRADLASAQGRYECVSLRELELSQSPALVASEAAFLVGAPAQNVNGIFGFADDTVRSIEYRRGRGAWETAPVSNNVFVALDAKAASGARGPRLDPIVQVRAVTRSGKRMPVAFVSGMASYSAGLPTVPSYLKSDGLTAAQLPGPARSDVDFRRGTIGWLVEGQARGTAWKPDHLFDQLGVFVYSRAVRPDPGSPLAVGLFLVRLGAGTHWPHAHAGDLALCETELRPLSGKAGAGESCYRGGGGKMLFGPAQPFVFNTGFNDQITQLTGAAADGVASLKLFLASGRVVPAALTDNTFSVSAPADQLSGKLVAYDHRGRVLGLQVVPGPQRPTPCPALPTRSASALPPPAPFERLDLAPLTVNGSPILGQTPQQVETALGKPDRKAGFVHHGFGQPTFFYGGKLPNAPLRVVFGGKPPHLRAAHLVFQGRALTESKLGRLLNVQPEALGRSIANSYPNNFHLKSSYGSNPGQFAGGCSASFTSTSGNIGLSFGLDPYAGARPFLALDETP